MMIVTLMKTWKVSHCSEVTELKTQAKRMEVVCVCLWMRSGVIGITCQWNTRYVHQMLSCWPYYIPREFSHVLITTVYVPPSANAQDAANSISSHVINLETSAPDAFNHCSLKTSIINYFQYVKCATQKDRILDQYYTNVKDTYTSVSLPPLRWSDHNIVQFIPRYRPLVQRELTVTCTIKEWSDDAVEKLKGSLDCTDWDVFVDSSSDINELSQCADILISVQSVQYHRKL